MLLAGTGLVRAKNSCVVEIAKEPRTWSPVNPSTEAMLGFDLTQLFASAVTPNEAHSSTKQSQTVSVMNEFKRSPEALFPGIRSTETRRGLEASS